MALPERSSRGYARVIVTRFADGYRETRNRRWSRLVSGCRVRFRPDGDRPREPKNERAGGLPQAARSLDAFVPTADTCGVELRPVQQFQYLPNRVCLAPVWFRGSPELCRDSCFPCQGSPCTEERRRIPLGRTPGFVQAKPMLVPAA